MTAIAKKNFSYTKQKILTEPLKGFNFPTLPPMGFEAINSITQLMKKLEMDRQKLLAPGKKMQELMTKSVARIKASFPETTEIENLTKKYNKEFVLFKNSLLSSFKIDFSVFKKNIDSENQVCIRAFPIKEIVRKEIIIKEKQTYIYHLTLPETSQSPHYLPEGFFWKSVSARFLDGNNVVIVCGNKEFYISYKSLGLKNKKTGEPMEAWKIFQKFGEFEGIISERMINHTPNIKQFIHQLSEKLKVLFKTQQNPFFHKRGVGYQARFEILW